MSAGGWIIFALGFTLGAMIAFRAIRNEKMGFATLWPVYVSAVLVFYFAAADHLAVMIGRGQGVFSSAAVILLIALVALGVSVVVWYAILTWINLGVRKYLPEPGPATKETTQQTAT